MFEVVERLGADFATRAAAHDRDASFPFENFDALHQAQLLSLTVPVEFGGQAAGYSTVCRVIETIAGMFFPNWDAPQYLSVKPFFPPLHPLQPLHPLLVSRDNFLNRAVLGCSPNERRNKSVYH